MFKEVSGKELYNLLKDKINLIGLEIGVERGGTAQMLLNMGCIEKLYGIDPYRGYVDLDGKFIRTQDEANSIKAELLNIVRKYPNYTLIEDYSDNCVSNFEDETLDFIFIDGHHSYEQCKKDINNYYPKIKKGGLVSGHDYTYCHGVMKAVDEFIATINRNIIHGTNDFWGFIK